MGGKNYIYIRSTSYIVSFTVVNQINPPEVPLRKRRTGYRRVPPGRGLPRSTPAGTATSPGRSGQRCGGRLSKTCLLKKKKNVRDIDFGGRSKGRISFGAETASASDGVGIFYGERGTSDGAGVVRHGGMGTNGATAHCLLPAKRRRGTQRDTQTTRYTFEEHTYLGRRRRRRMNIYVFCYLRTRTNAAGSYS